MIPINHQLVPNKKFPAQEMMEMEIQVRKIIIRIF